MGSPSAEPLRPGDAIRTVPPTDLNKLMEQAGLIFEKAKRVADSASQVMEAFADPKTVENMQGSMASVRRLLRAAEQGAGLAHAIFDDRRQAEAFWSLVAEVGPPGAPVGRGVGQVERI